MFFVKRVWKVADDYCSSRAKKSDNTTNMQNCMYFFKNKKIRKKVLTFVIDGVIITKLSARADAKEFF